MTVRAANFVDIPAITRVYLDAHQRSRYRDNCTLDPDAVKQLIARGLNRHGHQNYGGSLVLVSERDGEVEGFILGLLDSVYPCTKELIATDLLFICTERALPSDPPAMVRRLIEWGESCPKVIEVRLGITDAIGDWERTAKLYEHLGLERCGAMFKRGFER